MPSTRSLVVITTCFFLLLTANVLAAEEDPGFRIWLDGLRQEAFGAGISQAVLDSALANLTGPLPRVLELDRKQPESTQTLADYLTTRVSDTRIANGRRMLSEYPTWLGRVERQYGVSRRIIVALWGIESNYGRNTGGFAVIPALATLAYDGRRGAYFRTELLEALRILDAGHIPLEQMNGSWAGAMGQCQFMPSSFRRFAVDGNGDGRKDIWTSVPDVLASTANYLNQAGWQQGQTWGRPVKLPKKFDDSRIGLHTRLPLSRWQALGVRQSNGSALPGRTLQASLIRPDGPGTQAYLVYENFRVLLAWNRSSAFAVTVGTLADRLATQDSKGR
ncbi:MAG: lytic murein transglycosylase [Trichloromonadaceae bacterium]